jgi:hypothetical protein
MIATLILLALCIGGLNAAKGGGHLPDNIFFSKWAVQLMQAMLFAGGAFIISHDHLVSLICGLVFIFPHAATFALLGTSELHLAFAERVWDIKRGKPLNELVIKLYCLPVTIGQVRKWGVIYATLNGLLYYFPYLCFGPLFGVAMLFYGFMIGAMRYLGVVPYKGEGDLRWRIIEFLFLLIHALSMFALIAAIYRGVI